MLLPVCQAALGVTHACLWPHAVLHHRWGADSGLRPQSPKVVGLQLGLGCWLSPRPKHCSALSLEASSVNQEGWQVLARQSLRLVNRVSPRWQKWSKLEGVQEKDPFFYRVRKAITESNSAS